MPALTATDVMPDFSTPHFYNTVRTLNATRPALGWIVINGYLISLAAMMYGLDVTFFRSQADAGTKIGTFEPEFRKPTFYRISDGKRAVHFWSSASQTSVTTAGARDTLDKIRTKPLLDKAGVRTPFGGHATAKDMSIFDAFAKAGVDRLVVKPASGSTRQGVLTNLTLEDARAYVLSAPDVVFVAEQFIRGTEVRIQVVGDQVVSVLLQTPQHVVGDGLLTLQQLMEKRAAHRIKNPIRADHILDIPKLEARLKRGDLRPDMVPGKGKVVWLTPDTLVNHGTEHSDCRDRATEDMKQQALKAARCFGLKMAGIDARISNSGETYILELNSKPGFDTSSFPIRGAWNLDVPDAIVKLHFPHLKREPRRVQSYDFMGLADQFLRRPEVRVFKANEFLRYA